MSVYSESCWALKAQLCAAGWALSNVPYVSTLRAGAGEPPAGETGL